MFLWASRALLPASLRPNPVPPTLDSDPTPALSPATSATSANVRPHRAFSRRSFLHRSLAVAVGGLLAGSVGALPASGAPRRDSLQLLHLVLTLETDPTGDRSAYDLVHEAAVGGADMGAKEAIYNASLFDIELVFNQSTSRSINDLIQAIQSAPDGTTITTHIESPEALLRVVKETERAGTIILNAGAHADRLRGADCHPRLFHVTPSHAQHATALAIWMGSQNLPPVSILASSPEDPDASTARALLQEHGVDVADTSLDAAPGGSGRVWVTPTAARPSILHPLVKSGTPVFCPVPPPGVSVPSGASIPTTAASRVHSAVQWHPALFKYGATQITDRFETQWDLPMDGVAYANWLAMQIAGDAIAQVGATGEALRTHLRTATRFDGRKAAPISFRPWSQQARHELYIQTPDADSPVATAIPERMPDAPEAQTEALDALGQTDRACSLE